MLGSILEQKGGGREEETKLKINLVSTMIGVQI